MIPQTEFHDILRAVAHSARFGTEGDALNSVYFEFLGDNTRIVSTDGHRVTVATVAFTAPSGTGNFLAPIADIKELLSIFKRKSDKRVSFVVQGDVLIVTNGKATLTVERHAALTFPDYRRVIPDGDIGYEGVVGFASEYITQAIKACSGLIDGARRIDIITRDAAPASLRPVLDQGLEALQSLDIYIMPMKRYDDAR